MRLIIDHVFEQLPIHRLSLDVFAFNERAIAVYRKLGFMHEGILRTPSTGTASTTTRC